MKKFLNSFEDGVCAIILFVMLILTFVNVIARKFLVIIDPSLGSMPFIEELTCVGLMILSILGAATATKRGAHLGLSVFTDLLPKTAQSEFTNNVLSMGMSWPVWLYGIWLPIGAAVLFIRQVQLAVINFTKSLHSGKEENA